MSRIPTSGVMRWVDIQNSFGGSNPIGINEYYRNSTYVPTSSINNNIPTSGQIEATDFRGADGFSGTTGSFVMGNSGGKIVIFGYVEGQYGSNAGTAFTTNSGIKVNFYAITGFVGFAFNSATDSPATISNSTSNQLCNKVVTFSGSGTISGNPTTLANSSSANSVCPATFGGNATGTNNFTANSLGGFQFDTDGNTISLSIS